MKKNSSVQLIRILPGGGMNGKNRSGLKENEKSLFLGCDCGGGVL